MHAGLKLKLNPGTLAPANQQLSRHTLWVRMY